MLMSKNVNNDVSKDSPIDLIQLNLDYPDSLGPHEISPDNRGSG